MSYPTDYPHTTISIAYGPLTGLLSGLFELAGQYRRMSESPLIRVLAPAVADECRQATQAVLSLTNPALAYLTTHKVPLPDSPDRPADEQLVQLVLPTVNLQLLASLGPMCLDVWQNFIDLVGEADFPETRAAMEQSLASCTSGSAALRVAMVEAGVPEMPTN